MDPQGTVAQPRAVEHHHPREQGSGMPIRDWLRGSYRELAQDLLLNPANRSLDFVNAGAVRKLFDRTSAGLAT